MKLRLVVNVLLGVIPSFFSYGAQLSVSEYCAGLGKEIFIYAADDEDLVFDDGAVCLTRGKPLTIIADRLVLHGNASIKSFTDDDSPLPRDGVASTGAAASNGSIGMAGVDGRSPGTIRLLIKHIVGDGRLHVSNHGQNGGKGQKGGTGGLGRQGAAGRDAICNHNDLGVCRSSNHGAGSGQNGTPGGSGGRGGNGGAGGDGGQIYYFPSLKGAIDSRQITFSAEPGQGGLGGEGGNPGQGGAGGSGGRGADKNGLCTCNYNPGAPGVIGQMGSNGLTGGKGNNGNPGNISAINFLD